MRAGIDSHKRTLAVAIVDDAGRQVTVEAFANDPKGHQRLGEWLADHGVTRVGIEGSGHLGRAAAAWLVDVGFDVREVPCGFTVRDRRRRAGSGKSDPIDALAIARVTVTAARRLLHAKTGVRVELIRRRLDRVTAIDREARELKGPTRADRHRGR